MLPMHRPLLAAENSGMLLKRFCACCARNVGASTALLHVADPSQGGCLAMLGAQLAVLHFAGHRLEVPCQLGGPPTAAVRLGPRLLLISDASSGLHLLSCQRSGDDTSAVVQPVQTDVQVPSATTLSFVALKSATSAGVPPTRLSQRRMRAHLCFVENLTL